jgi:hypothetical protein
VKVCVREVVYLLGAGSDGGKRRKEHEKVGMKTTGRFNPTPLSQPSNKHLLATVVLYSSLVS